MRALCHGVDHAGKDCCQSCDVEREWLPQCDERLAKSWIFKGQEHQSCWDDESDKESRRKGFGDRDWNGSTRCTLEYATGIGQQYKNKVEWSNLSNADELGSHEVYNRPVE